MRAVVVTGLPASGKSTLAVRLANALEARLVSLDAVKEDLYRTDPTMAGTDLRLHAARVVQQLLSMPPTLANAPAGCMAGGLRMLDIWVQPGRDDQRVRGWLDASCSHWVEGRCEVPVDVALGRYAPRERGGPHHGLTADVERRMRAASARREPLGDALLTVDTSHALSDGQVHDLVTQLRRRLT